MSKARIPIIGISHRVVLPSSTHRITIPNFPEFSRGRKLSMFGVVTYKDPDKRIMYSYGTLVGVLSETPVAKSESIFSGFFDGNFRSFSRSEWQLIIVGVERFKILSISEDGGVNYASITIEKDVDSSINEALLKELRDRGKMYLRGMNLQEHNIIEKENMIDKETDPCNLGFYIASFMDLSVQEKQGLIENFNLSDRTKAIITMAKSLLSEDQLSKEVSQKMRSDIQKRLTNKNVNIMPKTSSQNEISKLETALSKLPLQEETKSYLTDELSRLKSMPRSHPEYNMLRNYIDTALSLPWGKSTKDTYDLDKAQIQLDNDHFGLEKIKKRIIEYIAVRGLKNDMKGSILCFTGPPGVGKTSLGKSIASAIGRKFYRISLGGVRDEAEIRGHRKTYIGSMPGVFINAMKRCGSNNPVILLDEIDKVGASARGDPASALLEVLDPAQNHSFIDHYLSVPFDLSKVLFIATANRPEIIPAPLLDRMEQIEITGYSTHEKIHIATQFLIPKQIEENGIRPEHIDIPQESVNKVILSYTRESGVRQLERNLGAICRWTAVKFSKEMPKLLNEIVFEEEKTNEKTNEKVKKEAEVVKVQEKAQEGVKSKPFKSVINEELVEEILGIPIFENDIAERVTSPGVAIGMAWTSYGGKIMIVETSKSPGHGNLRITGKLGEVMKESVLTAISWIKGNLGTLLPKPLDSNKPYEGFEGVDLHIHFPAAAVPKDGPSAGITITTALVSLLSGVKVRNDTAMTGEISLIGNVLPIGGFKEKVLGAHRVGIKRIILPYMNRKDLKDIPDYIAKEILFITVKKISEVLHHSLESNSFTSLKPKI